MFQFADDSSVGVLNPNAAGSKVPRRSGLRERSDGKIGLVGMHHNTRSFVTLLFIRNRIRYEREGRFRSINVILHRGRAAETDRSDNFSIHLDGKPATPRGYTRKRGDAG